MRSMQFENICAFRALGANQTIQGRVPQLRRRESNKQLKKESRRISEITHAPGISCFAPRSELKDCILLVLRDVNR
jgi:hypothetical protein